MPVHRTRRCAIAVLAAANLASAGAAAAVCDPHKGDLDTAKTLKYSGHVAEARARTQAVLTADPNDFRANYLMGTILAEMRPGSPEAIKQLERAASLLPRQDAACAKANNWYSLYNTLGAEFYSAGDTGRSKQYLTFGYQHLAEVSDDTKRKLLSNLGTVNYAVGDLAQSAQFYSQAARSGSVTAKARLPTVTSLQQQVQQVQLRRAR